LVAAGAREGRGHAGCPLEASEARPERINLVAHHRDLHRRQAGEEDEFRPIITVPKDGKDAAAPPADRDFRRVNHVGDHVSAVLARVSGGAFEEAVVRVGQGQQNRAFRCHGAAS
jgi:hypothetical protein